MKEYVSEDGMFGMGGEIFEIPWGVIRMQEHLDRVRILYSNLKGRAVVIPEELEVWTKHAKEDIDFTYMILKEKPAYIEGDDTFLPCYDALVEAQATYFGERNPTMSLEDKLVLLSQALVNAHHYIVEGSRSKMEEDVAWKYLGLKNELYPHPTADHDYREGSYLTAEPLTPEH